MLSLGEDPIAYHLVPLEVWRAAPIDEPFRAASLETEGFVHLTGRMVELVKVANAYYRDDPRAYLVLTIARRWVTSPWRYDGDERYPHVYGPIDREAITEVRPIPRTIDGTFLPIERPDERQPPDMPALLARLVAAGIRFVVVGSSGAALLGAHFSPGDLDICPDADPANLGRLADLLGALGARPRIGIPGWVTEEDRAGYRPSPDVRSLDFLFETPFGDLDLVFHPIGPEGRGSFDFDTLNAAAVPVTIGDLRVLVAGPGHLLASKVGGGRPKDLRVREELERLVREHGDAR